MTSPSAWYHRDVLQSVYDQRIADVQAHNAKARADYERDKPIIRFYRGWFRWNKEHISFEEAQRHLWVDDCFKYRYINIYRERDFERMREAIALSERSHNNLVHLDRWEVNAFGELLVTKTPVQVEPSLLVEETN